MIQVDQLNNGVNLFSGQFSLPINLASLPGRDNMAVNIAVYYNSAVQASVETWNLQAPTGILGLGWSLPYELIVANDGASYNSHSFSLVGGTTGGELILTGTAPDGAQIYQLKPYAFWRIHYYQQAERWEITRENGVTYIYGESRSQGGVQWGVRWNNWIGSSNDTTVQIQYALAWNLTSVRNLWGETITFTYEHDTAAVGSSNGQSYTRASYLSTIANAWGAVRFHYAAKDADEYQAPHAQSLYYQDRYETRYLASFDVLAPDNSIIYSLNFNYTDTHAQPVFLQSGNLKKRLLMGITEKFSDPDVQPGINFTYNMSGTAMGTLATVTLPEGGVATLTYAAQTIGHSARSVDAKKPAKGTVTYTKPRFWFAADYTVCAWYGNDSSLNLGVYTWAGRWLNQSVLAVPSFTSANYDALQVTVGERIFAVQSQANLWLFHRSDHTEGAWDTGTFTLTGVGTTEPVQLAVGSPFAAALGSTSGKLFLYAWAGTSWAANDAIALYTGPATMQYSLCARAGYVLAASCAVSQNDVPLTLNLYRLKPDGTWAVGSFPQTRPMSNINLLALFSGDFFVALAAANLGADTNDYRYQVYWWSVDFSTLNTFSLGRSTYPASVTPVPMPVIRGSQIAIDQRVYRFDGTTWNSKNLATTITYPNQASAVDVQSGPDQIVRKIAMKTAGQYTFDLVIYSPADEQWTIPAGMSSSSSSGNLNVRAAFPGTAASNYIILANRLYYLMPGGTWADSGLALPNNLSDANARSIQLVASNFVIYQDASGVNVYILRNGTVTNKAAPLQIGGAQIYVDGTAGKTLVGEHAFVAFSGTFDSPTTLMLYRVVRGAIIDQVAVNALTSCAIDDGYQSLPTAYGYDLASAICDPDGYTACYNKVSVYPGIGGAALTAANGYTDYFFFNGLGVNETPAQAYPSGATTNAADNIKPLKGVSYGFEIRDKARNVQGSEQLNWWVTPQALAGIDAGFYWRKKEIITIRDTVQVSYQYDYYGDTGLMSEMSTTNLATDGSAQNILERYAYFPSAYPSASALHLLTPVTQTTRKVNSMVVSVRATTWQKSWNAANDKWAAHKTYLYIGVGGVSTDFNFAAWSGSQEPSGADAAAWLKTYAITTRTSYGLPLTTIDADGMKRCAIYDQNSLLALARAENADCTAQEVGVTGFEAYESFDAWSYVSSSGGIITDYIISTESHTGTQCLTMPYNTTYKEGPVINFQPGDQNRKFIFSTWIKTAPGFSGAAAAQWEFAVKYASDDQPVAGVNITPISFTDTNGQWRYFQRMIDLGAIVAAQPGSPVLYIAAFAYNQKQDALCLIDDVHFYPTDATLSAAVYDPLTRLNTANIGMNGEIRRIFYDGFNRAIAMTGADDQLYAMTAQGLSRETTSDSTFAPNYPNSALQLVSSVGGNWISFPDGSIGQWQFPNNDGGSWSIANHRLSFSGTGSMSNPLNSAAVLKSFAWRNYGARVRVTRPSSGRVGIGTGKVFVFWNVDAAKWQFVYESAEHNGTYQTVDIPGTIGFREDWTFVVVDGLVMFFVDGIQLFSAYASDYFPQTSALQLLLSQPGSFQNVLAVIDPYLAMAYNDGTARPTLSLALTDGSNAVATGLQYYLMDRPSKSWIPLQDALPVASTPARLNGSQTQYLPGAASEPQGVLPYTENKFESSPLARLTQITYAGDSSTDTGAHPVKLNYLSTSDAALPSEPPGAGSNFFLQKKTDQNSAVSYTASDKLGRMVSRKVVLDAANSMRMTYHYDAGGNLIEIRPPNYYNPPNNSPAANWPTTMTYDFLGRMTSTKTPETGTTQYIYDRAGRLRFQSNDTTGNLIVYRKYDNAGRLIEEGTFHMAWNAATLQGYADSQPRLPDWSHNNPPDTAIRWDKQYEYDGDDTTTNMLGRLWKIRASDGSNNVRYAETFNYDIFGNVTSHQLQIGGQSYTTAYTYNRLGAITRIDYPLNDQNGSPFSVAYSYNRLGRMASIGLGSAGTGVIDPSNPPTTAQRYYADYTYNGFGSLSQEILNTGANNPSSKMVQRDYRYNPNGWLTQASDRYLSEVLTYTTGGYGSAAYYDGKIASEAYQFLSSDRWPAPPANYTYQYSYDGAGELRSAANSLNPAWSFGVGANNAVSYDPNGNIARLTQGSGQVTYKPETNANQIDTLVPAAHVLQGFETSDSMTGWQWGSSNGIASGTGIYTRDAHSGTRCLKVDGGSLLHYEYARFTSYVNPNGKYTLSCWVKTPKPLIAQANDAAWYVVFEDSRGQVIQTPIATLPLTRNFWLLVSVEVDLNALWVELGLGESINQVAFELRNYRRGADGSIGTYLLVDDFSLEGGTPTPAFDYDLNGNTTIVPTRQITGISYNPLTHLPTAITTSGNNAGSLTFNYDAANRRVQKRFEVSHSHETIASALYLYGIGQHPLVKQTTIHGQQVTTFNIYGVNGLVAVQQGGNLYYPLKDHLGSTRVVVDANADVVAAYDYLPFGGMMRSSGDSIVDYLYTGQEFDSEVGLYNYQQRTYDADLKRFYQADAVQQFASPYVYAGNSPVNLVDQSGAAAAPFTAVALGLLAAGLLKSQLQSQAEKELASLRALFDVHPQEIYWGSYIDDRFRLRTLDEWLYVDFTFKGVTSDGRPLGRDGKALKPGKYMYTVSTNDEFRYLEMHYHQNTKTWDQYRNHSQLAGGVEVYAAGTFTVGDDGQIEEMTNDSGHYKPSGGAAVYAAFVLALKYGIKIAPKGWEGFSSQTYDSGFSPLAIDMVKDLYGVPPQPNFSDLLSKDILRPFWDADYRWQLLGVWYHYPFYQAYRIFGVTPSADYLLRMPNNPNQLLPY